MRCDQCLYGLVERWPLKEGGWVERQSTQRTGCMTSMTNLARELIEVQGLAQGHELETGAPPCLTMHATERYPPRLRESRGDGTPRLGGVDELHDHPQIP